LEFFPAQLYWRSLHLFTRSSIVSQGRDSFLIIEV
jgi:hypothetical protein